VGVNYIKTLQGGFSSVGSLSFFRLAVDRRPEAPTVLVPLIGQATARSVHFEFDDGLGISAVAAFTCNTCQTSTPPVTSNAPVTTRSTSPKHRAAAMDLLQYARRYPHMVTQMAGTSHVPGFLAFLGDHPASARTTPARCTRPALRCRMGSHRDTFRWGLRQTLEPAALSLRQR